MPTPFNTTFPSCQQWLREGSLFALKCYKNLDMAKKSDTGSKDPLTAEGRARQIAGIRKFHENKDKPTSKDIPREPRDINNSRRNLADLVSPSAEIIKKAVTGGLTKRTEVWLNNDTQKEILNNDPSASIELTTLDNGKEIEVLVTYVPVTKDKVEIAKWVIVNDTATKKAAQENRLRRLEIAQKTKKAVDEGAIAKEDPQEVARELAKTGNHIRPLANLEDIEEFPDEEEFPEEDE